jgi:hypothetical protein
MCRANENAAGHDRQAATRCAMRLQNVQRIASEDKPSTRELLVTSSMPSPASYESG